MADTIAFELEDPDVQFGTSTVASSGSYTDTIGYELEDPNIQFGSLVPASNVVADSQGFLIEEPEILFGTLTPAQGTGVAADTIGYLIDQFIGDGVVKHVPSELTFEVFGFYLPRYIAPTLRSYEGDIELILGDTFDIGISGNDLSRDRSLQTAIMISLLTDRRAAGSDLLPSPSDRRGWWANPQMGSKLWLYERSKIIDPDLLGAMSQEAVDSLKWLVEDGIARNVSALATKQDNITVKLRIRVTLPRRVSRDFNYYYNIEQQLLR